MILKERFVRFIGKGVATVPVTIKDVAKMAGISISTVSRVVNNSKPVSSEIRDRVLKVIRETGYVPNPVARSLVMKKSQLIGVLVPDISNLFISELLNGIEEICKMYGYDVLLCNTYGETDEELKYINLLKSKQAAGVVFISWKLDEVCVKALEDAKMPCAYISKNAKDFDIYSVCIDHRQASYEMTKHLLQRGNVRIGFFRASVDDNIEDSERYKGYCEALQEQGQKLDTSIVLQGDGSSESGYALTTMLIDHKNLPDAIFAASDEMAIGVIGALIDHRIGIPEDISVAGYDDIKMASMMRPALTTIRQPIYDIGAVCVRMVVKLIQGEEIENKVNFLPYELIERTSSK